MSSGLDFIIGSNRRMSRIAYCKAVFGLFMASGALLPFAAPSLSGVTVVAVLLLIVHANFDVWRLRDAGFSPAIIAKSIGVCILPFAYGAISFRPYVRTVLSNYPTDELDRALSLVVVLCGLLTAQCLRAFFLFFIPSNKLAVSGQASGRNAQTKGAAYSNENLAGESDERVANAGALIAKALAEQKKAAQEQSIKQAMHENSGATRKAFGKRASVCANR